MNRIVLNVLALAIVSTIASAQAAGQNYGDRSNYGDGRAYGDRSSQGNGEAYGNRSGNRAYDQSSPRADTAQVLRVEIVDNQDMSYQRQQCWNEQTNRYDEGYYRDRDGRLYRNGSSNNGSSNRNVGGALIGALIGGALGNQVGKGDGRTAATIAGAVAGAAVGSHVDNNRDGYDDRNSYGDRNSYRDNNGSTIHCRTVGDYGNYGDRNGISGYNVTYRYAGQTYRAFTRERPGRYLRVMVDVRPNDGGVAYGR